MKDIILMPKGIAVWLKNNTELTHEQIADFCNLDHFTLNFINESNTVIFNPIVTGQLTMENIKACEKNPEKRLKNILDTSLFVKNNKRKNITAMQKKNKPRFIGWILKNYPQASLQKIAKFFVCREKTVEKIKQTLQDNTLDFFINPIKQGIITDNEIQEFCEKIS